MTAKLAAGGHRIYEVGISYNGRTYSDGKKITWRDGVSATRRMRRYSLLLLHSAPLPGSSVARDAPSAGIGVWKKS